MRQIYFDIKPMYVNKKVTLRFGDPATVNFLPTAIIFPHTVWS